ncbi:MAG: 2-C-methyl-D-erythritol 4-phosphate cytidylyltransferase [Christensenellaceae bacterium]|nr:2-C-methyl-D-erythritol 4-phosphate cytidylyltransferase [Christensenellaceae bacterium]
MDTSVKNVGVILAGGIGARLGAKTKKQYLELNGKECIAYVIEAYANAEKLDATVVVVNKDEYATGYIAKKYGLPCACGGENRNDSIYNGLMFVKENYPNCEKIIMHDAARPFIREDIIDDIMDLLDDHVCVVNGLPITDGIGKGMNTEVKREEYYISQTPEAFQFRPFLEAFDPTKPIVALSHHLPEDISMAHYDKFPYNYKLTFKEDVFAAETLLKAGFKEYLKSIKDEK